MPLTPGTILINRYRIAKTIKQSEAGALYRAWDSSRNVAVTLKEDLVDGLLEQDEFRQKALVLTQLDHPNLARVTDFFSIPNQGHYLVMEFIQGEDLETLLARGGVLSESQLIPWTIQLLNALDYLHSRQPPVIHGNIQPASIKIDMRGRVVLADPGIFQGVVALKQPGRNGSCFTPPEEYGRGQTGAPGDVYSLGATLYALLTGIDPPEGWQRQSGQPLPPPRALNGSISMRADAIIQKAMHMVPAKRYQHALEMKRALLASAPPVPIGIEASAVGAPLLQNNGTEFPSEGMPIPQGSASPSQPPEPGTSSNDWRRILPLPLPWMAGIIILLAIALTGGIFLFRKTPAALMNQSTATLLVAASPDTASATPTQRIFTRTPTSTRIHTATSALTETPTRQPTWYPCLNSPPSGLKLGMRAQVTLDPGLPNNVRASAGKSYPLLGKIQPGEIVTITNGPDCADGGVWWRIRSETSGLEGWTAEGDAEDHWLVPLP